MNINANLLNPLPLHASTDDWYDKKNTYHGACQGVLLPVGVIPAMQLTFHGSAPATQVSTIVRDSEEIAQAYTGYMYSNGIIELSTWSGDWPTNRMYIVPANNGNFNVLWNNRKYNVIHFIGEEDYTIDEWLTPDELHAGFTILLGEFGSRYTVDGMNPVFSTMADVSYYLVPCGEEPSYTDPIATFSEHIFTVPTDYATHDRKYYTVIPRVEINATEGMYYLAVRIEAQGVGTINAYSEPFKWVNNDNLLAIKYRRTKPLTDAENYMPFMDGDEEIFGEIYLNAELMMPPYGFEEEVDDTDGIMFIRKRVSWVEHRAETLVTGYQAEALRGVWHCDKVTITQHDKEKDVDYMPAPEVSWDTDNHLAVATLTFRTDTVVQTNGIAEEYVEPTDEDEPFDETAWLKITNLEESDIVVSVKKNNANAPTVRFMYTDGKGVEWPAESSTTAYEMAVPAGGVLYLRGVGNDRWGYSNDVSNMISATGRFAVGGKLLALLDQSLETLPNTQQYFYTFPRLFINSSIVSAAELEFPRGIIRNFSAKMFYGCTQLVEPPSFDVSYVAEMSFYQMFYGCTSLERVPAISNSTPFWIYNSRTCQEMFKGCTALRYLWEDVSFKSNGENIFESMFEGCTQITDASGIKITDITASVAPQRVFYRMFADCTSLTRGPVLPAKTAPSSHYQMFMNCTSLVNAPALPATTMAQECYRGMFNGCTSLVNAPALPATTMATSCYYHMFNGCTSLVNAPALPATTMATSCYYHMFNGCTSLVTAPALPATTMAQDCYRGMFNGCTSLVNAPALPATTLAQSCYLYMFNGCTSLVTAPALPATTMAQQCYNGTFGYCTSLTNAPKLPATTLAARCYEGLYEGCTALVSVPSIEATTLANRCFERIYNLCSALTSADFATIENTSPMMVSGCNSMTEFICRATTPPTITGYILHGMPYNTLIKVPAESVERYKSAAVWSSRAAYITAID